MTLDALRALWLVAAGVGSLYAFANLGEALKTRNAVRVLRPAGADLLRMYAADVVGDKTLILLSLLLHLGSAAVSFYAPGMIPVLLLFVSVLSTVVLSYWQNERTHKLMRAIRLRRTTGRDAGIEHGS